MIDGEDIRRRKETLKRGGRREGELGDWRKMLCWVLSVENGGGLFPLGNYGD